MHDYADSVCISTLTTCVSHYVVEIEPINDTHRLQYVRSMDIYCCSSLSVYARSYVYIEALCHVCAVSLQNKQGVKAFSDWFVATLSWSTTVTSSHALWRFSWLRREVAANMICTTLVNTHTDRLTDRQLLTGYTISWTGWAKNWSDSWGLVISSTIS